MILPFSSPFYHSKKNEAWLVMANRRKTNCGMIEVEVEDTVGVFKVEYKDPLDCFPNQDLSACPITTQANADDGLKRSSHGPVFWQQGSSRRPVVVPTYQL